MTISYELRNRPDKSGLCLLRIVYRDKSTRRFEALGIKLKPEQWDRDKQKVKPSHPQAAQINKMLALKLVQAATAAPEALASAISFKRYAIECMGRWERTKSRNTMRAYQSMLRQVLRFDELVTLDKLTPAWLLNYEDWCRQDGCNGPGVLKRVSFVSAVMHDAVKHQQISTNPFDIYTKPAKLNPQRTWLTMDEIAAVAAMENAPTLMHVAKWFLFSCYTGLRYSDVAALDFGKQIQEGRLILYTTKTGEVVSIKVNERIQNLINTWPAVPVFSNQKCNQYLKAIAHVCGINKPLTFHTGRHTFAVQCANFGISAEVASKLLGHSDLRTTMIYYKIINQRVDKEMEKWG